LDTVAIQSSLTEQRQAAVEPCAQPLPPVLPCYALHVRARWEKLVALSLEQKGYDQFLPLYLSRNRWSDRARDVALPLFPGYVFCRFPVSRRLPILTTPGVMSVVGISNVPAPVDEADLDRIAALVRSGLPAAPWPFLTVGQRVRVDRGAFAGIEGILVAVKKHYRVVVSVSLLQRSVAVSIERDWLSPL